MLKRNRKNIETPQILTEEGSNLTVVLLIFVVLISLAAWFAFDYGRSQGGDGYSDMLDNQTELLSEIQQYKNAEEDFKLEITSLERKASIEMEAAKQVQESNKVLQEEGAQLKKRISFMSGLLGGEPASLKILEPSLVATDEVGEFNYFFKITKAHKNNRKVFGDLNITFSGLLNDEKVKFKLEKMTKPVKNIYKLGFVEFQDIKGTIRLPEGFTPESVTIKIDLNGGKLPPYTETFEWMQLHIKEKKQ